MSIIKIYFNIYYLKIMENDNNTKLKHETLEEYSQLWLWLHKSEEVVTEERDKMRESWLNIMELKWIKKKVT